MWDLLKVRFCLCALCFFILWGLGFDLSACILHSVIIICSPFLVELLQQNNNKQKEFKSVQETDNNTIFVELKADLNQMKEEIQGNIKQLSTELIEVRRDIECVGLKRNTIEKNVKESIKLLKENIKLSNQQRKIIIEKIENTIGNSNFNNTLVSEPENNIYLSKEIANTNKLLRNTEEIRDRIVKSDPLKAIERITNEIEELTSGTIPGENILDDFSSLSDTSSTSEDDEDFLAPIRFEPSPRNTVSPSPIHDEEITTPKHEIQTSEDNQIEIKLEAEEEEEELEDEREQEDDLELYFEEVTNGPSSKAQFENDNENNDIEGDTINSLPSPWDHSELEGNNYENIGLDKTRSDPVVIDSLSWDKSPPKNREFIHRRKFIKSTIMGSPAHRDFLQASHRTMVPSHEVALEKDTWDKLQLKLEKGSPKQSRIHSVSSNTMRQNLAKRNKMVGLKSSRAFTGPKDKLLFNVEIVLPYGGCTQIQCFQDAPQTEIMDMLWNKLVISSHHVPTISTEVFVGTSELLLRKDFLFMDALYQSAGKKKDEIARLFLDLIISQKQAVEYFQLAVDKEISEFHGSINSLFRGNSFATVLIATFFRVGLQQYFIDKISPILRTSLQHPIFESSVDRPEDLNSLDKDAQAHAIIDLTTKIFDTIELSLSDIPPVMKGCFHSISNRVREIHPGQELKIIAGFLFLRLICPFLVSTTIDLGFGKYNKKIIKDKQQITQIYVVCKKCSQSFTVTKFNNLINLLT